MKSLRVSVVIPAYKAAGTICRAVNSVLKQTYAAAEIIVVDDGSPDDLAAALAPYGSAVTLIRQSNQGAAAARNAGIERATGDLIAFLDADDYWEPEKLRRHVDVYRRFPDLGLTCSAYFCQSLEASVRSRPKIRIASDRRIESRGAEAFQAALSVWTGTVVVPKRVLDSDRFVSGLEPAEDRHLWVRLICKAPMYCLDEPLATAVLEPNSLSRSNPDRDYGNMLRVVQAYRELLGSWKVRQQEADIFARWAGCLLSEGKSWQAIVPAMRQLLRNPVTVRGWWTLAKACIRSLNRRVQRAHPKPSLLDPDYAA